MVLVCWLDAGDGVREETPSMRGEWGLQLLEFGKEHCEDLAKAVGASRAPHGLTRPACQMVRTRGIVVEAQKGRRVKRVDQT